MKLDLAVMTGKGIKIFKFGKYAKINQITSQRKYGFSDSETMGKLTRFKSLNKKRE